MKMLLCVGFIMFMMSDVFAMELKKYFYSIPRAGSFTIYTRIKRGKKEIVYSYVENGTAYLAGTKSEHGSEARPLSVQRTKKLWNSFNKAGL